MTEDRKVSEKLNKIKKKKRKKKIKKIFGVIDILIMLVVVTTLLIYGISGFKMYKLAVQAKDSLDELVYLAGEGDFESVEERVDDIHAVLKTVRAELQDSKWSFAARLVGYGDDFEKALKLCDIADDAMDRYLGTAFDLLDEYPLSSLITDAGYNANAIREYLRFAQSIVPYAKETLDSIRDMTFRLPVNDIFKKLIAKGDEVLALYDKAEPYIPFVYALLGEGEDRSYLLVAQNSAEIRASGGFPGAMGTIDIVDGYLSLGDFESVYDVLYNYYIEEMQITTVENNFAPGWVYAPRDADFIPQFSRVAEIWSIAYEYNNGKALDGVISLTPAIIQDLLAVAGDITLADGTVLTSNNATKFLQYEIYIKYCNVWDDTLLSEGDEIAGALFAETAQKTMSGLFSNIGLDELSTLIDIVQKNIEKNIIVCWMKDEEEQEIVRSLKMEGDLNFDPEDPEIGVFYSLNVSSKLGWYMDIITTVSDGVLDSDGRMHYDVTVVMTNTLTEEEANTLAAYMRGYLNGYTKAYVQLSAPSGGTISTVKCSQGIGFWLEYYGGVYLRCGQNILLGYGESATLTYSVTTAPGVTSKPKVTGPPTLTEYR